ncbi:hypothetical protein SELMODRAFT_173745 [Selaginella moellendorffii]|uniref:Dienelactone hydrolase domain-containing protein n=1 Tax=Selaginella moellendorffii TaxID=88036 RepID=D8RS36_SELML|nr:endo-1,3;1,4-beta-D-glucanase [Selaginella moellendorffii]XP_002983545.1 endo-1,3;1,4-beta-D-glucanase [Selaginella moellendorffii]EFJ15446.1 hypothetical protein SELMODRAFT_268730 [Selaginella moellendorffii]EFJ24803.1 hypothetical protein SELMODRAFT_173745 [Selaginella moellendorffii]|eukprot:XP_002973848.1 endo-1,3;1,4-beta-D-glucanase [Selaginella moellendorffii]
MAAGDCCVPPASHFFDNSAESLGVRAYTNGAQGATEAVILVSDIFGWSSPLLRKLADKVAAAGYLVVVPDLLNNDPFKPAESGSPYATFPAWIKNHEPPKSIQQCKKIVALLKSKGITSIGIAGFCWGAKVAALMGREDSVRAVVLLHPSFVTVDDMREIRAPVAILAAEVDQRTPAAVIEESRAILASRAEVESFIKFFPGASHGWTVRYDVTNSRAVAQAEEAHQDMLSWFWRFLK